MRQGGASLEEYGNAGDFEGSHREETANSDFRGSHKTNHEHEKNQNRHEQARSSDNSDRPHTMRQGGRSLEERDNARGFGATHRKENEI